MITPENSFWFEWSQSSGKSKLKAPSLPASLSPISCKAAVEVTLDISSEMRNCHMLQLMQWHQNKLAGSWLFLWLLALLPATVFNSAVNNECLDECQTSWRPLIAVECVAGKLLPCMQKEWIHWVRYCYPKLRQDILYLKHPLKDSCPNSSLIYPEKEISPPSWSALEIIFLNDNLKSKIPSIGWRLIVFSLY